MGCDMHCRAERKIDGKWTVLEVSPPPFDWRSYGMYGFLADVRNYSAIPPIAEQRGLPDDAPPEDDEVQWLGEHSFSWLSMEELLAFNYDKPVEDRRVTKQLGERSWTGAATAEPGGGKMTTYREFLAEGYFTELERLKAVGTERIVFGFDS